MKIIMKSDYYEVISINYKTQAKFFKDVEVGDILQFSIPIEAAGSNSGSIYASYIRVENMSKKDNNVTHKSFNQLPGLLKHFQLQKAMLSI